MKTLIQFVLVGGLITLGVFVYQEHQQNASLRAQLESVAPEKYHEVRRAIPVQSGPSASEFLKSESAYEVRHAIPVTADDADDAAPIVDVVPVARVAPVLPSRVLPEPVEIEAPAPPVHYPQFDPIGDEQRLYEQFQQQAKDRQLENDRRDLLRELREINSNMEAQGFRGSILDPYQLNGRPLLDPYQINGRPLLDPYQQPVP